MEYHNAQTKTISELLGDRLNEVIRLRDEEQKTFNVNQNGWPPLNRGTEKKRQRMNENINGIEVRSTIRPDIDYQHPIPRYGKIIAEMIPADHFGAGKWQYSMRGHSCRVVGPCSLADAVRSCKATMQKHYGRLDGINLIGTSMRDIRETVYSDDTH